MAFEAGGAVFTAIANFSQLIGQSNQASRALGGVQAAARGVGTAAGQAEPRLAAVERTLADTGAVASRTAAAVERTGAASTAAAAGSGRLRAAQLSVVAAQERYNAVLASGGAAAARLASAEAALLTAQERETAVLADGTATAAQRATATARVSVAQERYNALLAEGGIATGRLATAEAGLLRAQTRLAAIPPIGAGWRAGLVGAVETVGKLGLSLGAFALAIEAVNKIKLGAQFQRQMLMIQTNANASAAEVRTMTGAVLALAGPVGAAPTELATSLYHVEQNGLRGAKALDVVKIAAQGAQIGNADLEETTNSMTAAVVSGIPGVQNMAQAMGALITIVGTGDMKMSDLNEALGSGLLAVAKGYGLSLKDVGAALAVFGDNNIRGANAATALRQAIMAFAKPAVTAKKGFAEIGLSLDALGKDMQTGGLNKAVQDLNSHMVAAGITGNKVGAFLTDAFGKKAGVGLNILLQQIDRFNTKQEEIAAGSGSFAAKWDASTHTAGFAFRQLSAEADAAGIVVYNKLQPALYDLGRFLGVTLPAAVSVGQRALRPLEHELGAVLVPALKMAGAALGLAAHGLEDVGQLAARHTGTVQVLGTVVLGMWAAWKAWTIAQTAARGISAAIAVITARAAAARAAMTGMAAGTAAISASTLALGGIGVALAIAAYAWQKHQVAVAADRQMVEDFTSAINEDSGALGENTKAAVINALEKKGALEAASRLGVSLSALTDAALGNTDAYNQVTGQVKAYAGAARSAGKALDVQDLMKVNSVFGDVSGNVDKSTAAYQRQQAAADKSTTVTRDQVTAQAALALSTNYIVDSGGGLVQVQGDVANAAAQTTQALKNQKTAADLLKDSWDALDGTAESAEQTQNAFLDSLDGLNDSVKQYGRSLNQNTAAGRKNREQVVSIIDAAKAQAQATADVVAATHGQTAGLIAGNAQLKRNEAAILSHAAKLHMDKQQVQDLISALGQLSEIKPLTTPKVDTRQATQTAAQLKARLADLSRQHTALVKLNDGAATPRLLAIEAAMNRINGQVAHARVVISVNNLDVGRAVADAANRASGHITIPGGHVPARAAGGLVPDGWFTKDEQGWELGYKQGSQLRMFSHTDSVRMMPAGPAVPTFAQGSMPSSVSPPSWSDLSGLVAGTGHQLAVQAAVPASRRPAGGGARQAAPPAGTVIENVNIFNPVPERTSESLPSRLRSKVRVGV